MTFTIKKRINSDLLIDVTGALLKKWAQSERAAMKEGFEKKNILGCLRWDASFAVL